MQTLVVVTQPGDWPSDLPGVRVVPARSYLADPEFSRMRHARVFNLCRQYRYQALGYYVSLLAEARGHRPVPTVLTMQDLRSPAVIRVVSDEIEDRIRRVLNGTSGGKLAVDVYFGRTPDPAHDRLGAAVFQQFPVPMMRATFTKDDEGWQLSRVNALAASAIDEADRSFAVESARAFFSRRVRPRREARTPRFDLAILWDRDDPTSPSDGDAIRRFVAAADDLGIAADVIDREDAGRLLEYDALFIRSTTAVHHHTYRLARHAAAEGMVVIDDPVSILRCTNKVFLAELMARHGLPTPRTVIAGRDDRDRVAAELGFPCIVKQPDSSSSLGVFKADNQTELSALFDRLFAGSDLLIAQEFLPTRFDWRIGVLDREPLFAARYFMAPKHWQIIHNEAASSRSRYGKWEVVGVDQVPEKGLVTALAAANLIGDGLYGVDLKEVDSRWVVIEVNDNPNIENGVEDLVLKDGIYRRVMETFLKRLEAVTAG